MKKTFFKRTSAVISTAALALVWPAVGAFAQTNLILNGSFESGGAGVQHFSNWDLVGPADNFSSYGVAASGTSPDVAQQGSYFAYFHGHPTDSSQDCLGQTVNLIVGRQYTISYYLATDGNTFGSGAAMWAVIGTSFGIDYSQDILLTAYYPNSSNAIPYQKFTTTITATNANVILSFHAIDATSSILLDNVTMTLVVPPAPQLNVTLAPTNKLAFTWNSATAGFFLQTNASLRTTNWVTLTNAPVVVGSSNRLVLPASGGSVFYRLKLP
jgi:hypothetical protein